MLKTFEELKKNFKLKPATVVIDNPIFKCHYRITTLILLISTILVSSRQYIGEHIHCINDKGVENHVMNTFCFFTTTFTVPRHLNSTLVDMNALPHPGVGPLIPGVDEEKHHAYYQWVPFVLFGQAIAFYIPHFIWKRQEGGRLKKLITGFQNSAYAFLDKEINLSKDTKIPTVKQRDDSLRDVRKLFVTRLHVTKSWSLWLVSCEILNAINLVLQVYLTNKFLSGQFYSLGPQLIQDGVDSSVDILDIVFPKVTKCTFHKYGPSGTIQSFDAMCVMALNIVNEKIYAILWFWYLILGILTLLGLIWRMLTLCLHSRSHAFNMYVFSNSCPGKLNPWRSLRVTREYHFSDWLFLYYLSKNLDPYIFKKLFIGLAEDLDNRKLIDNDIHDINHDKSC